MATAGREINSDNFSDLEKKLKRLKAQKATPATTTEIAELELKINQTLGKAYATRIVTDAILGTKSVGPSGVAEVLINQANKSIAAEVSVKSTSNSGKKFNAGEAAARAARGVK
jgi:NAD(P)H-hydrate repair Nnr-like enzyme with NAD(P)H-hydrate epimerase domain